MMAWWKLLDAGALAQASKTLARWRTEGTRSRKAYRMALRWKQSPADYDWLELPMVSSKARKRFLAAAGKDRADEILREFRAALKAHETEWLAGGHGGR